MPRGPKADIFGAIRAQAAKVLQQLERQIHSLEGELAQLRDQLHNWRQLTGGPGRGASTGRRPGRPAGSASGSRQGRSGGRRVKWDEVLAFVPKRFGVQDVMRHPGAAAKGRAQVYPALNRWESTKRIRRISKGVYEKAGASGDSAQPAAKRGPGAKRAAAKKRGPRATKRGKAVAARASEAKAS